MLTDVAGVRVGHWTDADARTGCTVVLLPEGTVASAEVRGGAPATRELDALQPGRVVERLDAVLLTGGSAFGLAAADGVVRWCEEHGIGFPTAFGVVPIVAALGLYDLGVGDAAVRPGPDQGYAASDAATDGEVAVGAVGAGTGATVRHWRGADAVRPGGLGSASLRRGDLVVAALVAVNAFGDVDEDGSATADLAGSPLGEGVGAAFRPPFAAGQHTTIGVVITNADLDKQACHQVAQGAHDGYARALFPAHTRRDGDAVVAAATGERPGAVDVDEVRSLAVVAVERAIRTLA